MIVMIDSDRSTMLHNGTRNRTTATTTTATPSKRSNSTTDIANYYKNNWYSQYIYIYYSQYDDHKMLNLKPYESPT